MNVYLTGIMGCGKSTVGRLLADELAMGFIDLDDEIARREGISIPELFAERGEAGFRAAETEALRCCEGSGFVVATGGGIVTVPENIEIMKRSGVICFIERGIPNILKNINNGEGRPLIAGSTGKLETIYERRLPLYRASADVTVRNDDTAKEAAVRAARVLREKL